MVDQVEAAYSSQQNRRIAELEIENVRLRDLLEKIDYTTQEIEVQKIAREGWMKEDE